MNLKKLASVLAIASLALIGSGAPAAPTITNTDGPLSPFGGFDWASGSTAWTSGFTGADGSSFTLYYAGFATAVLDTDGNAAFGFGSKLDSNPNGSFAGNGAYEYTIFASITEKVVSCGVNSCQFQVTGGNFDIYYDYKGLVGGGAVKTAVGGPWSGFKNGIDIIKGTIDGSATNQTFTTLGGNGSNSTSLTGRVTNTNIAYVNPALVGTRITSTLQLGQAMTAPVSPTSIDGFVPGAGQIVFQADANQSFFNVPEPGVLALTGLALVGCGFAGRRRKSS